MRRHTHSQYEHPIYFLFTLSSFTGRSVIVGLHCDTPRVLHSHATLMARLQQPELICTSRLGASDHHVIHAPTLRCQASCADLPVTHTSCTWQVSVVFCPEIGLASLL